MDQEIRQLARRANTHAQRFVGDAGIVIGAPATVEAGSKVLNVPATTVARVSHKVVMVGAAGAAGTWGLDTLGGTSAFAGLGELATGSMLAGVGASLVASAPATPRSEHRIIRIPSQKVRRGLMGGGAAVAAVNYLAFQAGMGGHHTVIAAGALAAGAAGYVAGL